LAFLSEDEKKIYITFVAHSKNKEDKIEEYNS
jgi:hypothetical protein